MEVLRVAVLPWLPIFADQAAARSTSSISARSVSLSLHPAADAFACTCEAEVAPAITEATGPCAGNQDTASSSKVRQSCEGYAIRLLFVVRTCRARHTCSIEASEDIRRVPEFTRFTT